MTLHDLSSSSYEEQTFVFNVLVKEERNPTPHFRNHRNIKTQMLSPLLFHTLFKSRFLSFALFKHLRLKGGGGCYRLYVEFSVSVCQHKCVLPGIKLIYIEMKKVAISNTNNHKHQFNYVRTYKT